MGLLAGAVSGSNGATGRLETEDGGNFQTGLKRGCENGISDGQEEGCN